MNEHRRQRIWDAARRRQPNLTVILENVHDTHNISAVLRSCDAVGIKEIFVLFSEEGLSQTTLEMGKRTSKGTRKWIDVHFYKDTKACFEHVKSQYDFIFSTHIDKNSQSLYDLNLTDSIALLFGNERDGVSQTSLAYADGNFIIPQVGLGVSLNISVACAVTLYEALRQRSLKGFYDNNLPQTEAMQQAIFQNYMQRCEDKYVGNEVKLIK